MLLPALLLETPQPPLPLLVGLAALLPLLPLVVLEVLLPLLPLVVLVASLPRPQLETAPPLLLPLVGLEMLLLRLLQLETAPLPPPPLVGLKVVLLLRLPPEALLPPQLLREARLLHLLLPEEDPKLAATKSSQERNPHHPRRRNW